MALADTESNQNEKGTDIPKSSDKREKPLTKVIIRRLPPGITQESFLQQVSPIPEYNYIYTVKGDMSLGENSFSRVYVNFLNSDDIFPFKEKFDNYVFVDTKGHEYPAVVEFAAFQKVPKRRGKVRPDPKCATIESDPLYLEFLESLKNQPNQDIKPEYSYQPSPDNKSDASTPLLDFIKQRRLDRQRIREEKKEERRRKDIDRKRFKDEERKKHYEDKPKMGLKISPSSGKHEDKTYDDRDDKTSDKADSSQEKSSSGTLTYRNRKYDDRKPMGYKPKSKFTSRSENMDYYDRRDTYKGRREENKDYKKKVYEEKKDLKNSSKKIKKYSERREELKAKQTKADSNEGEDLVSTDLLESSKASSTSKNIEELPDEDHTVDFKEDSCKEDSQGEPNSSPKSSDKEQKHKNKENDPRLQRRIRNKDRPAMEIYKPGMLKKKSTDPDVEGTNSKCSSSEKE